MLVLQLRSVEHQTVEFNEWFKGGLTSEVDNAVLAREWLKTPRGRGRLPQPHDSLSPSGSGITAILSYSVVSRPSVRLL